MIRRPPRSTRTDTLFPYTTLFRSVNDAPLRITGTVGSSLYKSARAAGVPARLVAEYIKALSFGIDFQRDVGANAKFDIIFEHRLAETGETETGRSEEHTSELQSLMRISYAVFCLKKKNENKSHTKH